MKNLCLKCKRKTVSLFYDLKTMLKNNDGDQLTGWLIVILLVVVVGAFFLRTYQNTITDLWDAIVDKIYDTFGI